MSNQPPTVTSPPWSVTTKRIIAVIALGLVLFVARQVSASIWSALAVALVLAYLLSPVVTFFEHRLGIIKLHDVRRTLAVFLAWINVLGVLALILILVVPATVSQLRDFADTVPDVVASTEADLERLLNRPITVGDSTIVPWEEIQDAFRPQQDESDQDSLTSSLQSTALSLADSVLAVVSGAVQFLITLAFALVLLFYLMRDGPQFAEYLAQATPETYRGDVRRLMYELGLIWNAYLRGQILLCLSVGVATYVAALILGLPQPLLLAFVAGFLEFIPNLGPTLAQIPALLFALTTPSSTIASLDAGLPYAIIVSLTYILIQNLEAIFLVPRIMGHSLNLHPFVVLLAVLIGANLMGVLGVVLAAPIAATIRLLGRYVRGKLLEEDVFPSEEAYVHRGVNRFYLRLIHYLLSRRFPTLAADDGAARPAGTPSALVVRSAAAADRPVVDPPPDPAEPDVSHWAL